VSVDRWQYVMVLGSCLLITLPLESFGSGVYRQPRRLATAMLPVTSVFLVWDGIAVAAGVWWYNSHYLLGLIAPGGLPLEELLFFLAIPLCGLLTYSAVDAMLSLLRRRLAKAEHR
jgi:lycopene cyclase domain-containing protein